MGAKLNFKTLLLNSFFDFLSHLSGGSKLYVCTETLVLSIYYLFTARCVLYHCMSHFH
jgi:hypothetical protein